MWVMRVSGGRGFGFAFVYAPDAAVDPTASATNTATASNVFLIVLPLLARAPAGTFPIAHCDTHPGLGLGALRVVHPPFLAERVADLTDRAARAQGLAHGD